MMDRQALALTQGIFHLLRTDFDFQLSISAEI
jgi:hypothetical protein